MDIDTLVRFAFTQDLHNAFSLGTHLHTISLPWIKTSQSANKSSMRARSLGTHAGNGEPDLNKCFINT